MDQIKYLRPHVRLLSEKPWLDKSSNLIHLQTMILSAVITEAEEGGYVAFNPETGTTFPRRDLR